MAKETPGAGDGEGKETVLDAINAALGDDSGADHSDGGQTYLEDGADARGEEEGAEDQGAEAEGAAADGAEAETDGADGKDGGEGEAAKPKPGEEAAAKKPEGEGAGKKPDHVNDPIPKEWSQEAQTRIRSLIKTNKELTASREQVQQNHDFIVEGLRATGTTPAQYGEVLSWLSLFNSGDPAQQEKALELVESVADRLATLLGKERKLGDPLAGHADLANAVAQGQMTKEWARQLAVQRNSTKFKGDLTASRRQTETTQQQQQRELAQARTELNTLEDRLRKSDPRFEEKRAIIVPALRKAFQKLSPTEWATTFEEAYKGVKLPPRAKSPAGGVPANQPLRARQGTGGAGAAKAPSSALEAVNAALAGMK